MTEFCVYCHLVVAPHDKDRRVIAGTALIAHKTCIDRAAQKALDRHKLFRSKKSRKP